MRQSNILKVTVIVFFLGFFGFLGIQPSNASWLQAIPLFLVEHYPGQALASSTLRPESTGDRVTVQDILVHNALLDAIEEAEITEIIDVQPGEEAPTVDLGVFQPTGQMNPDGTQVWAPADESILAGSIEVDVRPDGRIIRQRVFPTPQPETSEL